MKKPTKKKPDTIRETIQAPYHFSDKEKQELGDQLAHLVTRKGEIEQEKSQVVSQYGSKLKEVGAQISGLSNKLTSGVETRPQQAVVEYDAKRGMKMYLTDDKKKTLIREEPMTPGDWQLPMFKPEEVAGKKPEATPTVAGEATEQKPKAGKKRASKPAKASPAGETSLADALSAAAAGADLPMIPFIYNEMTSADTKRFMNEFRRAAKAAEWPEAAISTMRDVLRKAESVGDMLATLEPHIAAPTPDGEGEPTPE